MFSRALAACWSVFAFAAPIYAEVAEWKIVKREPYAEGKPLGDRGAYERWTGKVRFAIDPKNPANEQIVDLDLAPVSERMRVEFAADFEMLVPVDRTKANGAVFYEVNNRGNKTALSIINGGADEFLCRQGFVVLWSGWIAEVQPGGGKLRLTAPIPLLDKQPLRGIVRSEFVVDKPVERASISHRGNIGSYRPAPGALEAAKVSRRQREQDPREPISRSEWNLVISDVEADGETGQLPLIELEVKGGIQPGWIYEIVYQAQGSLVQGVGLAGIRDILSSLKYDLTDTNPLKRDDGKPLVERAIGFGTSQSGRCLRHFLWEGFNADEQGRKVFDGVISHVAGGGLGSFNHRFCSPTRTNGQHDEHLYPADVFPFTYGDEKNPLSGGVDGILAKSRKTRSVPKVFHTQSSSEYWHRSGSLVHTDPLAQRDAQIPPEVRLYTFGGTQHGPGSGTPGQKASGKLPSNPADYRPLMRGLLTAMDAWIAEGTEPPASVYPKVADGTLVGWKQSESGWPEVPEVEYPQVIQQPPHVFRGPDWESKRIATIEPPEIKSHYVVKVPAIGKDGNERGTLNLPAISVPVASYTSWNLRDAAIGAEGELLSLQGAYIPLPRTKAERTAAKDPRPSLEELYRGYDDYERKHLAAAEKLVAERYMLAEDLPRIKALCEKFKPTFAETPAEAARQSK